MDIDVVNQTFFSDKDDIDRIRNEYLKRKAREAKERKKQKGRKGSETSLDMVNGGLVLPTAPGGASPNARTQDRED